MNAKELYVKYDKSGKAPGQWLGLKSTKKLLDKDHDALYFNKVKDEYVFSEQLLNAYEEHLNNNSNTIDRQLAEKAEPSSLKNNNNTNDRQLRWEAQVYSELKDFLGDEMFFKLLDKSTQSIFGISASKLFKDYGVKDVWKEASPELKQVFGAFFCMALVELKAYKKKIDPYLIRQLMSSYSEILHVSKIIKRTKEVFIGEDHKVVFNNRMTLSKVKK